MPGLVQPSGGAMQISVGIDIAKEVHWVTAIDPAAVVLIDRKLENIPTAIAKLIDELAALGGSVRIGFDVVGGIAGLAEAMLAEAGFALVHVPGLAVNRARQGAVGGEHKSDPRDARVIAEQVRIRHDLRRIEPATELDLELRLLVGRRQRRETWSRLMQCSSGLSLPAPAPGGANIARRVRRVRRVRRPGPDSSWLESPAIPRLTADPTATRGATP